MIQRIQTIYLAIVIILLSIVTVGTDLFSFVGEASRFTFSAFGITEYSLSSGEAIGTQTFPMFVGFIALVLLSFITLMAYKNLERQFKLGRTVFYIYFLSLVAMIVLAFYGNALIESETSKREMGLGFILFVAGFPFTFLANTGIKRDRNLLKSLDRLR